ncbi:MAG: carbohydrate ABC transporter permease [Thermomicrobiales bacterium]
MATLTKLDTAPSTDTSARGRATWDRLRRPAGTVLRHAALILLSAAFILPFLWMISTSLKSNEQILAWPPTWIPNPIQWSNYSGALDVVPFLRYTWNTAVISALTIFGSLISSTLVAYGFSRLEWPGRDTMFVVVLASLMLPFQVTMIPLFIVFSQLGWTNSVLPLTVPYFFGHAFYIFLLRQFFNGIPRDFTDAARLEGASEIQILWQIVVPLAKPALITVALFQFLFSWKDFLGPLLYLNDEAKWTLSLGLANMQSALGLSQFGQIMAVATMVVVPVLVAFLVAQRFFIQGIATSGLKG